MKLLFVIKGLVVKGGGAERVFVDVANALFTRGHSVELATFDAEGESIFYAIDTGIPLIRLSAGEPGQPTPRAALPGLIGKLRRLLAESQPDVVVSFMHSAYVPVGLAMIGSRIPLVASEHIDERHFQERRIQQLLKNFVTARAAAKTVPTEAIRREHGDARRNRVVTIHNPVDLAAFEAGRLRPAADPPHLLAVGRFMEQKDFGTLIAAFAKVAADFPTWRLRIVGSGPLRSVLEQQVATTGFGDRIDMPGVSATMADEYADAAFLVVPSLYESFGLVTAEALASSRPVIGFADCVGTAELVVDGHNGLLLVPGEDRVAALEVGLRLLMGDADLRRRLGMAGPGSVVRFEPRQIIDRWEELLTSIGANARG